MSDRTDESNERAHDAQRMGAHTHRATGPVRLETNVGDESSYGVVRVLVAMPHVRLCRTIATALESTGVVVVVAEAGDIVSAVESTLVMRPGVVLLGISLVDGDIVEGVQVIVRALDGVPAVLAGHEDGDAYEAAVIAAGAAAYVPLQVDAYAFARVLRCAAVESATQR
jgi:DNA-binding NarL/FixJ family response regulator